jgi:hypothetical protein
MKHRDVRTLALMARVARVREIQAKQALAEAIGQKDAQAARTDEARVRTERSDTALHGALRGPLIDLARLPLWQALSSHAQATLEDEREQLRQREHQVVEQAGVAGKQARHRERLEEKAAMACDGLRQAHDARQLDFATEAWLARRNTEAA